MSPREQRLWDILTQIEAQARELARQQPYGEAARLAATISFCRLSVEDPELLDACFKLLDTPPANKT